MNLTTNELIKEIATQLQISTSKIFEIFVSVQQTQAILYLSSIIIFCFILPYAYTILDKKIFKDITDKYERIGNNILFCALILLIYIILISIIINCIVTILHPNYTALLEIITILKR